MIDDKARSCLGRLFHLPYGAVVDGDASTLLGIRIARTDARRKEQHFLGNRSAVRADDDVGGVILLRMQPDIVGRRGADEAVVLQIVTPRQDFEPVLFKTAEGVFGRSLLAPFLGLFQKPRKLQFFFEAFEIAQAAVLLRGI